MSPRISVILPVYNLQNYLATILDNLIFHQFANVEESLWEIIIINDGSTDSTQDIAEWYHKKHPKSIISFETAHQGVSKARNLGIANATGKYIYFIDGDDLLTDNALPRLLDIADKYAADILHFGFTDIVTEDYNKYINNLPLITIDASVCQTVDANEFMSATQCMTTPSCQWSVWQKLFRKGFIVSNNLEFPLNVPIGEDAIFNIRAMLKNPVFVTINAPLYLYHKRSDSAIRSELHKVSPNHFEQILKGRELYLLQLRDVRKELIEANCDASTIQGLDVEITHIFYDYMLRLLLNDTPDLEAMNNNCLTYSKRIFPESFSRINQFLDSSNFSEHNIRLMKAEIIPTFYAALADTIANGARLHEIYAMLCRYKSHGGHIKFGKPRFRSSRRTKGSDIRRWIAAYIFALILKA